MKKIPTLFMRDFEGDPSRVLPEINPECQWVADGEGHATQKLDGTCCMIRDTALYKRREVKRGKPDPFGFELVEEDPKTGKRVGWVGIGTGAEDQWYIEAIELGDMDVLTDGTYELVGPKVQGNPEGYDRHTLVKHSAPELIFMPHLQPPRDFEGIKNWMKNWLIEGVVWHHPDGRMAKLKLKDFGLKRDRERS